MMMMIRIQQATKRTNCCHICSVFTIRTHATETARQTVEYPKIEDLSPKSEHRRQQERYFEKIRKLGTVEEKLLALNLPRYYGWSSFVLKEGVIPYNFLPFTQFITRTVISESNNLPSHLTQETITRLKGRVKHELEKVILFENTNKRYRHELETIYAEEEKLPYYDDIKICDIKTRHLVKQMNSALVRALANEHHNLFTAQVDLDPRVEAFWRVGGFYTTEKDRKLREEKKIDKSMIKDPIDRFFQYFGSPILHLRSKDPLQNIPKIITSEFMPKSETPDSEITETLQIGDGMEKSTTGVETSQLTKNDNELAHYGATTREITDFKRHKLYQLQEYRWSPDLYLEITRERLHGAVIPGFWPNDPYGFGIVSFHSTSHFLDRPAHYGSEDAIEALHSQAILASYAWAYGQACYHGFTTYNDITYPISTQAVLTNGKLFSFYQYQLNTMVLHTDNNEAHNPLRNECYATPPIELYHDVGVDKVNGWNDDAILNLLNVYTKPTHVPADVDLCPYLDKNIKLASLIQEDERRKWLHDTHRYLASHRPRHKLAPEIYDWERIFKIENKKEVLDARKRFFEQFLDPINDRRLNEHLGAYIPRKFRKAGKFRDRYTPTYYPDAFPEYHEIV